MNFILKNKGKRFLSHVRNHYRSFQERSPQTAHSDLAGNIAATLADPAVEKFSEDDEQFIKFHGIYQQDDRDLRKTGKKWLVMIRGRIPGGVMTSSQWKTFDDLATQYGNNTLRVTTRQSIQFHGVVKAGLGPLIKKINESMLSTLAACGDVNRNITVSPMPATTKARADVFADGVRVMEPRAADRPTTPSGSTTSS